MVKSRSVSPGFGGAVGVIGEEIGEYPAWYSVEGSGSMAVPLLLVALAVGLVVALKQKEQTK